VGVADVEQSEAAETRLVSCSPAELVEVADGVALGVADGGQVGEADGDEPLPAAGLTTQMNDANPTAPVVSVAATVTRLAPAAVGVPEIRPEELIDTPAGSPVAV